MEGAAISDFSVRKSFVYFDPYDRNANINYAAHFKFEDKSRLRASVVLDVYKKQVQAIPDDKLSIAEKESKQQVIELIDHLGSLKIVDAQVLFKLYDLHRYKI
jgi:transcriptional/translational regulatory protein YebC/TACO1